MCKILMLFSEIFELTRVHHNGLFQSMIHTKTANTEKNVISQCKNFLIFLVSIV